ncbi:MAG: M1 family aminopeptidase, partial [Thermoplasmata archaeon]
MQIPKYRIRLELDEGALTFAGRAEIELEGAPASIRLNSRDLEIRTVGLDGAPHPFSLLPESEELVLGASSPGDHRVEIAFAGRILSRGLIGLYRATLPEGSLIASMMFPNGTRRVFPCLDDPAMKSVFEFTIVVDTGLEVISNTDPVSSRTERDRTEVVFAPTPKMSTYLIFFAAGRFGRLVGASGSVRIGVRLPPGRETSGRFALEHAERSLAAFNEYYGIPYPLGKLDLVSVPDFWAGAMENWGAIAFLETRLLADDRSASRHRRRIRETISHEIAHQWFGNLVTMVWWNDFWLNESFASFMQARIDERLYPELGTRADFLLTLPRWGLRGDALRSTHTIEVPVRSASDLGQIADEITYGKGATVLGMIEAYLGEAAFREGVRRYLTRFAYGSARSEDLWHALEEASERPVGRIMEAWVRRPGYPVLTVTSEGDRLRFEQRRYLLDGGREPGLWPVPLTFELDGTSHRELFESASLEIPRGGARALRVNPGRTGFYRVLYTGALFGEMVDRFPQLPETDRWGLLTDAHSFLISGDLSVPEFSSLLRAAAEVPAPLTGGEVTSGFFEMEPLLGRVPELRSAYGGYFRQALDRLG